MYYIVYGFLYLLSLLPLRLLYVVSDFFYLLLYYVFRYRKKIVLSNLAIAFPNKTEKERVTIAKKFYRNFSDTIAETVKLFSAGEAFIRNHFTADYSVLDRYYDQGRNCQLHLGHNFNWELAVLVVPLYAKHKLLGVYMPLNNKVLDRIFIKLRSKTGATLISAHTFRKDIREHTADDPYILALIADQNPPGPENAYWINFFGRPTPFLKGPEKGARLYNQVVVFAHILKDRRGHYHGFAEIATEDPRSLPEGELTKRYVQYLERVITANPEMWLWSHRRWKHEWREEYGVIGNGQ